MILRKFKAWRIVNDTGHSIGKQDYYTSLGSAKRGLTHCWGFSKDSKIIEIEVTEEVVSELKLKLTPKVGYQGKIYYDCNGVETNVEENQPQNDSPLIFEK